MTSVLTGFPNLDLLIGGMQQADMLLLASSPPIENINLALSIVSNVAMISQHRVGIFTLAMNKHHLVQRLLALATRLDLQCVRTGVMTVDDRNHLVRSARTLSHAKIWIDDTADMSVLQLQQRAQAMVKTYDTAFLLIDNIHCLRVENISRQRKDHISEMGEMSDMLRRLAKDLNIPILVLAPCAFLRTNRLKGDEAPHQDFPSRKKDANHALFLYRESVSQCVMQNKSSFTIPLLVVNHQNGFVIDVAFPSQLPQTILPDAALVSLSTAQDNAAS